MEELPSPDVFTLVKGISLNSVIIGKRIKVDFTFKRSPVFVIPGI